MGSDFWLPDYSKLAKNLKKWQRRHNLPTRRHRQISFDVVVFLLSLFTGSSFMSILLLVLKLWKFLYKRNLTRNWKYTSLNFDQYLGMGATGDTKFGLNVSNEKLLNATKVSSLHILPFLSYYGKTTGGGDEIFRVKVGISPSKKSFFHFLQ